MPVRVAGYRVRSPATDYLAPTKHLHPGMISQILVPVDFSPGSAAALRYAEAFAAFVGAELVKAIHIFTPQTAGADAITALPVGELMDEADTSMQRFLAGVEPRPGVNRRSELLLGFAADKIVREGRKF